MSDKNEILVLFDTTEMYYAEIAEATGYSKKIVLTHIHKNRSREAIDRRTKGSWSRAKTEGNNAMRGKTGEQHHNWVGGVVADGKGYLMVKKPDWYTGRDGSKYVFQHQIVFLESIGLTHMPSGFVVHHLDGDKTNNVLDNLCFMTNSAHTTMHHTNSDAPGTRFI
jgi:HNH endonuclease